MGFNRMVAGWFKPTAQPSRQPRNIWDTEETEEAKLAKQATPTIDEQTAQDAKLLIESQSLERVFDRLRGAALAEFTRSRPGFEGVTEREKAHMKIAALDEMKADIHSMADQSKFFGRKRATEYSDL